MRNKEVAELLYEIADYLEMKDVDWKPRAYRRAARNIESLSEDIEDIHERGELQEIEGVGESISEKISEYLETGELEYYKELKEDIPVEIDELTAVQGLGPQSIKQLYEKAGIANLDQLEEAAKSGVIADIEGFGAKKQEEILDKIEVARKGESRLLLGDAFNTAKGIEQELNRSVHIDKVDIVGSFRRRLETIGDLDILALSDNPEAAMDYFCNLDEVEEVLSKGETKSSVIIFGGLQIDLRIVDKDSYGSALQYFTGSIDHNIKLRTRAENRDWKLNEYGLFDSKNNKIAGESEKKVYNQLGLDFIPPEMRENTGEIETAEHFEIPDLVESDQIRGDLQMHTDYSDGRHSIREMAEKAEELGYEYILITDHGPSLEIAGAPDIAEFQEQKEEIREANNNLSVDILHGVEANITADGLDLTKDECEMFDIVVVALHGNLENPTARIVDIIEEFPVDILAHPLNRMIHRREAQDLNLDLIVEKAAENHVALEINAQPSRLDLPWNYVKKYRDEVKFVVSTDAHSASEMDFIHFGVSQARRGWCEKDDILNTSSLDSILEYFE